MIIFHNFSVTKSKRFLNNVSILGQIYTEKRTFNLRGGYIQEGGDTRKKIRNISNNERKIPTDCVDKYVQI